MAIQAVRDFLQQNTTIKEVNFVLFSQDALAAYKEALKAKKNNSEPDVIA